VLIALSLPIEKGRHNACLRAVAGALAASPARMAGVAHRIGREVQRQFFIPPRMSESHPRTTARQVGFFYDSKL
jgi:hypothetical protein